MTRETKIGLLVGLAFIIVVGILLSDHMTSAIEPASAPLQVAGSNLRSGLGQPASDQDAASNAPLAADTARVTPAQPVPTQEELSPPPVSLPKPVVADPPVTLMGQAPPTRAAARLPVTLAKVAHESGEELVDANGRAEPSADVETPTPANRPAVRNYKAQAGDSLSKIAARLLGANTKSNRDLIVALNRTLQTNPNRIIVGHTYAIPVTTAASASATPTATAPLADADDTGSTDTANAAPRRATADPVYLYTVKPGDTLWKIAVNELGDADTVPAIEELNQDVLKGAARIHPKMKLRLPAKPVADAN